MSSNLTETDLRTLADTCAGRAEMAPKLFNPLLAVIFDALRTARTGEPPAFNSLPIGDLRGDELHTALHECSELIVTLDAHGRTALAATMGSVLDELTRHAKATRDAAGLNWLAIQRDAIRLMVREYREQAGAIW